MAPGQPDLSIVIPTLDRWPLLSRALASALDQRDTVVEVIVVDDGSTDETRDRLAEHPDERVRVIRAERPRGVACSRNAGIAAARAPATAFLDDDDLWAPLKSKMQLDALARAGARWSWTAATVVDETLRPRLLRPAPTPESVRARILHTNPLPALSAVIVRTDLLRDVGGFDETLSVFADWDLWIRLSALDPGTACPEPLTAYVEHGANMHLGNRDPWAARPEFERLAAKHAGRANTAGVRFGALWWRRWIALNHRLAGRRRAAARAYLSGGSLAPADLGRAAGALTGPSVWRRSRERIFGRASAPDWLAAYRA